MANTGSRYPLRGQKLTGAISAVGQWDSSGPWRRTNAEQIPERIRVWLQDKAITRGKRVFLYTPVRDTDSDVIPCTCQRVATDASQRRCDSCYGVKFIPGIRKFAHSLLYFASAEYASFALTNTVINTLIKPFPILLTDGSLTGTVVTTDKSYSNPKLADWSIGLNAFLRADGATLTLEYSTNGGLSYTTVVLTNPTAGVGLFTGSISATSLGTSGNIRFRITMTRVNIADAPTAFEILRMRRVNLESVNLDLLRYRPDLEAGEILIEKTWFREVSALSAGQGRLFSHESDGSWAMPLDFYNTSIVRDTPAALITTASGSGHHAFFEYSDGVLEKTRYLITELDVENQISIATHQAWVDQRVQAHDPYSLVW